MNTLAPVTLRRAVSADADGIAAVFAQSAEQHAGLDPERYYVPAIEVITAHYRQDANASGKTVTIVAQLAGAIVGFVDARLDRSLDPSHSDLRYCHIDEIAVDTRWRSRGIGGQLLRAAEDWGRRHGAAFAYLEYHVDNVRAGEFYQRRMGYRVTSLAAIRRL